MSVLTEHSNKIKKFGKRTVSACLLALSVLFLSSCREIPAGQETRAGTAVTEEEVLLGEVPDYTGSPYVEVEGGEPDFEEKELTDTAYESYSDLDSLGRCQEAIACVGRETMPDSERESISQVHPSGWQTVEYDEVDGGYLYNRCHLIGYQLTAENANEKNLITGTRYMNTEGMLPFETEVADYVEKTGNHVLYRVDPVFEGENLVASGVWMEAESVEDGGRGISFNVYVYNVQPGIEIDYAQGDSCEADEEEEKADTAGYVLNTNTRKFHKPDCSSVADIHGSNRESYTGDRQELLEQGYSPCGRCRP